MAAPPSWLVSGFSLFSSYSERLGIATETAVVVSLLLLSLLCCAIYIPVMFCCSRNKAPGSPYTRREILCKKGLFALMLARLDEFDTLTPLILTPGGSNCTAPDTSIESRSIRGRAIQLESDSPPPPRRPQHGKTLIVPLNASRYRMPPVPLLGTPDSRVTSLEGGTTKSCATIPEDDEDVSPSSERFDDLVSIDRTSASTSQRKSSPYVLSPSTYNLLLPQQPPEFQIPVPQYSAPDLPRPKTLVATREERMQQMATSDSSSIGSANSSLGTSPVETTGSASDSFYINSDVISSTNGSQIVESGCGNELDEQSKYILHRIEEESEIFDESSNHIRYGVLDKESNAIPRSISEQFEMLRRA